MTAHFKCNYPNCDGGHATGYCHSNCVSEIRMVPCETCGGEGRDLRGHPSDPHPRDCGPCISCEGTGLQEQHVEPAELEDFEEQP